MNNFDNNVYVLRFLDPKTLNNGEKKKRKKHVQSCSSRIYPYFAFNNNFRIVTSKKNKFFYKSMWRHVLCTGPVDGFRESVTT